MINFPINIKMAQNDVDREIRFYSVRNKKNSWIEPNVENTLATRRADQSGDEHVYVLEVLLTPKIAFDLWIFTRDIANDL